MANLTGLLQRCRADAGARDELFRLVYDHLHRVAVARAGEWHDPGLEPTELINEAYLKLFHGQSPAWKDRAQFFGFASHVMANLLRDFHRRRTARKRGGGVAPLPLRVGDEPAPGASDEAIRFLDLMDSLAAEHPLSARVAELHFCGGRDFAEITEILEATEPPVRLTAAEVEKHWKLARAWIRSRLQGGCDDV